MALQDLFSVGSNISQRAQLTPTTSGTSQVMGSLEQVLGSNSPYIENARRRGLELAATRGGINSSIAAGSSERSAIEAAQPLVQQGVAIDQANLQQAREAEYNDWLSQQNFGRAIYGQKFNSSLDMLKTLQNAAISDPELYTPEVTSGLGNFFQRNFDDIMKRYFGG